MEGRMVIEIGHARCSGQLRFVTGGGWVVDVGALIIPAEELSLIRARIIDTSPEERARLRRLGYRLDATPV
jgi:hypothetical protein